MKALFKSQNLIGDGLYIGPALRKWIQQQTTPLDVWIQTLPDHVAPLYEGMVRDLWNPKTTVNTFGTCFDRPDIQFDFEHTFDVSAAFKVSDQKKQHLAKSYADLLGVELEATNEALKPIYIPDDNKWMEGPHAPLGSLKGCILLSMFSASCQSRDKNVKGLPPNKMLPFEKWKPLIRLLRKEYPMNPIRTLGAPTDAFPVEFQVFLEEHKVERMHGIPLNRLALIMQHTKLLVTIDNGMSHLAASQETPTFLMYPRCLAPHFILPIGNPNLQWVHVEPSLVNPAQLHYTLEQAIKRFKHKETECQQL